MALHELTQKTLEREIKKAHETGGVRKIADGEALFLVRRRDGGLSWQLEYTLLGQPRKTFSLGTYPKVGLSLARQLAQEARELVRLGRDPVEERRKLRKREEAAAITSVATLIDAWYEKEKKTWGDTHREDVDEARKKDILPYIGAKDIRAVTTDDIRDLLKRIEEREATYMLTRVRSILRRAFEYGIDQGWLETNPVERVRRKGFTQHLEKHHPALVTPQEFRQVILALDRDMATMSILALRFQTLVFVRPQNLISARWEHMRLDEGVWEIPDPLMKKERAFLVPLATQTVKLLANIRTVTGDSKLVFPSYWGRKERPHSENTFNMNLWRLGFKHQQSVHGFRASAKTMLEEGGYDSKYTKKQLAHDIDDKTERAYNRAEYWDIRVEMMQAWADYVDALRTDVHLPYRWFGEWRAKRSTPLPPEAATTTSAQLSLGLETRPGQ